MNLAELSIKRPILITCLVIAMLVLGVICFKSLSVDKFPDTSFPTVSVTTTYSGAGPNEIETLVTKPIEDELSTIAGLKRVTSSSLEGRSIINAEFNMGIDSRFIEQKVRDKINKVKAQLPSDLDDPEIVKMDTSDQAIIKLVVSGNLSEGKLYDIADQTIKPNLEQINNVGAVKIKGGRKREIHVVLDRNLLKRREFSVTDVVTKIAASGENVPGGTVDKGDKQTTFRSLGEFKNLKDIKNTIIGLYGNELSTKISDLGEVLDTLKDETSRVFVNNKKALIIEIYRQSGTNTVAVADEVKKKMNELQTTLSSIDGHPKLSILEDSSDDIKANVKDVEETIILGILLTILVVYFFLANGRSTIITGLALPTSLIGSFILMKLFGFSLNVISLMALSLAVGLLIDDAIVVRENIFRKIEGGMKAKIASIMGTNEVQIAVIATTLVILSVFAPVGMMSGVIGQFLKQFGLTVCFAMIISLFDSLTLAPMLSTYLAVKVSNEKKQSIFNKITGKFLSIFEYFTTWLENRYERLLHFTTKHNILTLVLSFIIFVVCCGFVMKVPLNFMPESDNGEFGVSLELAPGANLDAMNKIALKAEDVIKKNKDVTLMQLTVGGTNDEPYKASIHVKLAQARNMTTTDMKAKIRKDLQFLKEANPKVNNYDPSGSAQSQPLTINVISNNQNDLIKYSEKLADVFKKDKRLKDVDTSYRLGKPEIQIKIDEEKARIYGINTKTLGNEIRAQVEGLTPVKYRENGKEYEIRVRLKDDQRDLSKNLNAIFIPNVNGRLIRLTDVANIKTERSASTIERQDRSRYLQVSAALMPGIGLGNVISDISKTIKDLNVPSGTKIVFTGESEKYADMMQSLVFAIGMGILFIFLVLSSLYESFITPLTIMLALPLAICGAFVALFITGQTISMFTILGIIMLLGVACKNSILLVDYISRLIKEGKSREDATIEACKIRLRPILMTSFALIAGMLPVAIGLSALSSQRQSMGIAIIGGVISSTILTLVVVPSSFHYIDKFRIWSGEKLERLVGYEKEEE